MLQPLLPDDKTADDADNDEDQEEEDKRSEKVAYTSVTPPSNQLNLKCNLKEQAHVMLTTASLLCCGALCILDWRHENIRFDLHLQLHNSRLMTLIYPVVLLTYQWLILELGLSFSYRREADINVQERKQRQKERKKQAEKFWEERDEEDLGEGLTGDSRSDAKPERAAIGSHAAAGKVIGKLSSKSLDVLEKPSVSPEIPFTRGSDDGKDQNTVSFTFLRAGLWISRHSSVAHDSAML